MFFTLLTGALVRQWCNGTIWYSGITNSHWLNHHLSSPILAVSLFNLLLTSFRSKFDIILWLSVLIYSSGMLWYRSVNKLANAKLLCNWCIKVLSEKEICIPKKFDFSNAAVLFQYTELKCAYPLNLYLCYNLVSNNNYLINYMLRCNNYTIVFIR